jgi:2-oxo-3-hexenedioate decarboxylase
MAADPAVDATVRTLADELARAYARGEIRPSPSAREGGLSLETAYEVEAELASRRRATGHRAIGLKVGFANKAMWRILKLETLVWAHMYDDTVHLAPTSRATYGLAGRVAPRIEPEIVFRLSRALEPGVTDPAEVLDAVEWMALGFEINDCVFPAWKFQPADFVAAFGFHTALFVGPPRPPRSSDAEALAAFGLRLSRNGQLIEEGAGKNALRSPALCLAELAGAVSRQAREALQARPARRVMTEPLVAGDLVSTGTLTTPQPMAPGESWRAEADVLDLPPLTLEIT